MMYGSYNFGVIKGLRKRLALTLEQLALKSGLTYPTVASVENNKTLPTMKTLDALAGALEVSASNLLALAERRIVQIRKALPQDMRQQKTKEVGLDKCKVARFDKGKLIRVAAQKGEKVHVMGLHEDCHEACYVLSGTVQLRIEDSQYELKVDDTILFDGVLDHAYSMVETGEFITVHIPKDIHIIEALLSTIEHPTEEKSA